MTEEQITIAKDIRRRGKNKVKVSVSACFIQPVSAVFSAKNAYQTRTGWCPRTGFRAAVNEYLVGTMPK